MNRKLAAVTEACAIFLLLLTPVISLYRSQEYPLASGVFIFFLLMSLAMGMAASLLCRYALTRLLVFMPLMTWCILFLLGSSIRATELNIFLVATLSTLLVVALKNRLAHVVIAATLAVTISSFFSIERQLPRYLIDRGQLQGAVSADAPRSIIHLVFDEAAGLDSIRQDFERAGFISGKLSSVLEKHGFTNIKHAHSSSMWTKFSLGHMVYLDEIESLGMRPGAFYFEHSPLFDLIFNEGYRINIMQSESLDFCYSARAYLSSCYEYPLNSMSYFSDYDLEQLSIMVPATVNALRTPALQGFVRKLSEFTGQSGIDQRMPRHFGSLSSLSVRRDLISRLQNLPDAKGQYYFVHILYPHHAFFQRSNCEVRASIYEWIDVFNDDLSVRPSPEERIQQYTLYLDQYECFIQELDRFLSELEIAHPNSIVILHGDHGSRISTRHINDDKFYQLESLNPKNYRDLYPTMLALKHPDAVPGTIDCRISLVEFAQHFFRGGTNAQGEKTRKIAMELFEDIPDCADQLPTIH